jgi:c-di-GMP-binding flagellar brake protein YcgR
VGKRQDKPVPSVAPTVLAGDRGRAGVPELLEDCSLSGASVDGRLTRYPIALPLLYTARRSTRHRAEAGWTRNLSESGACLLLPERLPLKLTLQLRLQTDGGPINAEAQVIWAGKPGFDLVRHGVAFTRIAPDQRRALRDLLRWSGSVRPAGLRLSVAVPITCRCRGQAQPPVQGWSVDLSRGGLSFTLPHALPLGTELVITLRTPTGPLTLAGTVVWAEASRRRPRKESVRHGFQFSILDAAVDLALARLLTMMPRYRRPSAHAEQGLPPP